MRRRTTVIRRWLRMVGGGIMRESASSLGFSATCALKVPLRGENGLEAGICTENGAERGVKGNLLTLDGCQPGECS